MANTIRIKRSGTANTAPTSLEFGELALNYADGKIYYKNTSNAIVQLSGSSSSGIVTDDTAPSSPTDGTVWLDTTEGRLYIYYSDGTSNQWVEVAGSGIIVEDDQNILASQIFS